MLVLAALGLAVVLALRLFVGQAFVIPTASMQPALQPGDRVLVLRAGAADVRRGDVVVFDGTGLFAPGSAPSRDFVKRVIGMPGDRVACCDDDGRVTVDGEPLHEPYIYPGDAPSDMTFDVLVPAGRLWMMGDHRSDSADSRAHLGSPGGGMVPVERIVGRVVSVAWPVGRWSGVGRWAHQPASHDQGRGGR